MALPKQTHSVDLSQAEKYLLRFLSINGITGQEQAIGKDVVKSLQEIGIPRSAIRFDRAHEDIPLPTQTGNLIVQLPGSLKGPRRMFMTHLDTVPLCAGAKPVRKGNRIVNAARTALGGDNRTGVACLMTLISTLRRLDCPHPPLTFLFTVREESGLWGARCVNVKALSKPAMGFNFDGGVPSDLTAGAVGADRWQVEIEGRAAHAGVHPEKGISATMIASLALAEIHAGGWFGKVKQKGRVGTSNVGSFGDASGGSAGVATNVVTDSVHLKGESRSHDAGFIKQITSAYKDAFQNAAKRVRDDEGRTGKVKFQAQRDYHPFHLKPGEPVVQFAMDAVKQNGFKPNVKATDGGLDANWIVRHGIPTVTLGAGQRKIHTIDEYVELPDYLAACRIALTLATA